MDELLREFLTETHESLDVVDVELVHFERDPNNAAILDRIFRLVHTIKGTCGFLGLPRLEQLAHAAESLMGKFRDGAPATAEAVTLILATIDRIKAILDNLEQQEKEPDGADADLIENLQRMAVGEAVSEPAVLSASEHAVEALAASLRDEAADMDYGRRAEDKADRLAGQSIRVPVDTLEHLMTMVSELVLTRNQLLDLAREHSDNKFSASLQRLSHVTAELQEGVMKTRMQPIGHAWQKLPRIVRDLAHELDKDIDLELQGEHTELDRQVLELIKDPLTHMVRNSADHGLETRAERIAAGKSAKGRIRLSAYHQGGQVVIEIADDGRGLDTARIREKALALGLVAPDALAKMSNAQIHRLIFAAGFSTAQAVTSISGRGVGMDVVRSNVDKIGGMIDVKSIKGAGVVFTIKIPLTLAIISALIVSSAGQRFAIPQVAVVECVRLRAGGETRIERIKDASVLRLRNSLLPVANLSDLLKLNREGEQRDANFVVVAQSGNDRFGIVVEAVHHTEEIVVKPMSSRLRSIDLLAGNTILGDGSVIMIIDPNGIVRRVGSIPEMETSAAIAPAEETVGTKTSLLLFRAGSAQPKAVPLSLVARLEVLDARTIEMSNGRHMVQYRGQLMPLVAMNGSGHIKSDGSQPILVFSEGGRHMALAVDQIIDIVEDRLSIEVGSETAGILGSAIVKGQATEIVDVSHFLPLAVEDWFRNANRKPARAQTLLLVDDSPFFRNMLTPVLQAAGYAVTALAHAHDALALLQSGERFDIVVTDIEMPDMNGFELAAAVRGNPALADIPMIALSSLATESAFARGREAGLLAYVAKFDRAGLIAALKAHAIQAEAA